MPLMATPVYQIRAESERGEDRSSVLIPETLQLSSDGFGEFFVTDEALDFFYDLPVLGDKEASGIAEKAAKLVSDVVVADDDGIVHGKFLARTFQTFLGEEGRASPFSPPSL